MIDLTPIGPDWVLELAERESGVPAPAPRVLVEPMTTSDRLHHAERKAFARRVVRGKAKREAA